MTGNFDSFCKQNGVTKEEREALVHFLASMRYRETLELNFHPIHRAARKRKQEKDTK